MCYGEMVKVINVIPITRGVFRDELTYFTASLIKPGAIVSVPLRGRSIEALVSTVREVNELKLSVKNATYPLKKITRLKHEHFFTTPFMELVRLSADYSAAPLGATIKSLVPTTILNSKFSPPPKKEPPEAKIPVGEFLVLQEPDEERHAYYKSLIRAEFAKHGSVFLCLPTVVDINHTFVSLKRGISEYTIVLHHQLSTRELIQAWQKALELDHPVLIIATPIFLSLPRTDLRAIIVDRESTPAYKSSHRPFLDYRRFAEYLAKTSRAAFVLGDTVLRTETTYRTDQGEFQPLSSLKYHAASTATQTLITVKKTATANFRVVSDELREVITETQKRNEKIFICHRCGARRSAAEKCRHCGGWRLLELGIGIDRVARELGEYFPELKLFKLDSDTVRGGTLPLTIVKRFLSTPGSVLLGTEMALCYLKERIENVAVVALDSLFALPDYRVNERVFSLLIRLRSLAGKHFIIQTRNVKIRLFEDRSE